MSTAWPHSAPEYTSLAAAVQGEAARWNVPGIAAAILHHGQRTEVASGVTNLEHPVPVMVDTRFQVGSISKVYTATAIMMLVEQGKLDLDAPISRWLPELPLKHGQVLDILTVRHLLNHTTGFEGDVFFDTGNGDDALELGMTRLDRVRHWTIPEEIHAYCNTGFYVAGRVIETVTEKPYEVAMQELLLDPLGAEQTTFASADLITWPTASGHTLKERKDGHRVYRPWALPRVVNAAGGVVSTVGDLIDFATMHMDGGVAGEQRLLSEESARQMQRRTSQAGPMETGFGIGWNVRTFEGIDVVGHGGATNGFRAQLSMVPEHGFVIAMLTNGDAGTTAMDHIQRWALKHVLDVDTPQREHVDCNASTLDSVTGRYERHDAIIDVWRVNDHLHIERRTVEHEDQFSTERSENDPPSAMNAWYTGDNVYRVQDGPFEGLLIDMFRARLFDTNGDLVDRSLIRMGGRIAERTGDAPEGGPTTEA